MKGPGRIFPRAFFTFERFYFFHTKKYPEEKSPQGRFSSYRPGPPKTLRQTFQVGIGTCPATESMAGGCRGIIGPDPPPLWIRDFIFCRRSAVRVAEPNLQRFLFYTILTILSRGKMAARCLKNRTNYDTLQGLCRIILTQ